MEYEMLVLPIKKPFRSLNNDEAHVYFNWFMQRIPPRRTVLENAVRTSGNLDHHLWEANLTINSLDFLGRWFSENAELYTYSDNEKAEIFGDLDARKKAVVMTDTTLTESTFSIATDVGMYLGEVLRTNLVGIKWKLLTRPRKHIDFHQPILEGFQPGYTCNPVAISIALASKYAWGSAEPADLINKFYSWKKLALINASN